jgi:hypothetical protein
VQLSCTLVITSFRKFIFVIGFHRSCRRVRRFSGDSWCAQQSSLFCHEQYVSWLLTVCVHQGVQNEVRNVFLHRIFSFLCLVCFHFVQYFALPSNTLVNHAMPFWYLSFSSTGRPYNQWRQSWGLGGRDPQILKWVRVRVRRERNGNGKVRPPGFKTDWRYCL